jgi:iron transport multicopper oxidase
MHWLLPTVVFSAIVTLDWNVTYVNNVNPDGQFFRRAIGVNGVWPPPAINVTIGDTLVINVENQLDVPTSLHTHGLFHNKTNYMDGAAMITECGIAPGTKLTYSIPIEQTGSYWIHGHMNGQYVDGLQAALILHDPEDRTRYRYDEEYTLAFTDWYHEQHAVLLEQFLGIYNPQGAEPIPNSALINHGQATELIFIPGKTYRLRLISMTALAIFHFYIDDHKLQIIEVDGELVEPYEVDMVPLSAAQRYSVLVTAKNTTNFNYRAHGKMDQGMLDSPSPNPNATVRIVYDKDAPVYVKEAGVASDFPSDPSNFDQLALVPIVPELPVTPDMSVVLNVNFLLFEDALNHGTFNETIFELPHVPSMFTALSMGEQATNPSVYGPRTLPTVLKHMDMVEVIINNLDAGHHPFHLHGHKFQIVQVGEGIYDASKAAESNKNPNPPRRDTVIIPGKGFAVLRFRADNPGVWLMHCHVEWHCILDSCSASWFSFYLCGGT